MTAQQYIIQALLKCGHMRSGYTPSADLLGACFTEWLAWFDSANAERTMQYADPDYVYPVTAKGHGTTGNNQSFGGAGFTIGPGATDFSGPRPVAIARCNLLMTSASPTNPTRIPLSQISMEEYLGIAAPQIPAINVTSCFAYDAQFPIGVIWTWPPLVGNSLEIFTWGQLTPPASLASTFAEPPGYWDAIVWTLAERCWPLCTHDIMPHKLPLQYIAGKAKAARDKIKAVNAPSPRMACDFSGGRPNVGACDWELLLTGRPY
jgi:hypothetical protein